jgi:hypothetical protein
VSLLASLTLLICLFASPPPPLEFSDDMHIYFCDTLLSSSNPACPSACLNICLAAVIPLCKSDNLPVCLSAYQPVCIYACFLPWLSASAFLSICLSVCLCLSLPVSLSVCLSAYLLICLTNFCPSAHPAWMSALSVVKTGHTST